MVLPNLPQEIIAEILTRLPVKSLLLFRCVSKSCLSLIDAPQFVKSHLNFSVDNNKCNSHRIALNCLFDSPVAIYSCLLDSAIRNIFPVKATLLDYPLDEDEIRASVGLLGSCNGLICISIPPRLSDCVVLWNPSTRKCRKLPHLTTPPRSYGIHGFGYDELIDDYKLVQIIFSGANANAGYVYSLRTNSWRNIKVSGLFLSSGAGKFADGALHWLVRRFDFDGFWSISSFDLANETFQNIDFPNSKDTDANWDLGVLGGCLCLSCDYYQNRFDLWILENGVKESWTKLVSIPYSIDPEGPISPLFVSENGEILLKFGSQFMLYNKQDKTFYYPNIHMGRRSRGYDEAEACIYVESLVSPNTSGEGNITFINLEVSTI